MVARINQQVEQVRLKVVSVLRLQFLNHLRQLIHTEDVLTLFLKCECEAPDIDPGHVDADAFLARQRQLNLEIFFFRGYT